ncbi:MAG: type I secretion system permease/ATPase [Conexibacteraceae bacterium]|nr:type I secretion system permease/ATPase [Conexibacteraceae bacterium]
MLAGSLYMLQVYDRVIPSRSVPTLLGLSAIVLGAYLLQGYFDSLRTRMMARIGTMFDAGLQVPIYNALVTLPLRGARPTVAQQPLRDLDQVRSFLSGTGPTAFLDMPWTPIFLLGLYVFHPVIGLVATLGAASIIAVTLATERHSRGPTLRTAESSAHRQVLADATRLNADVIRALGMTERFTERWLRGNDRFLEINLRAMDAHAVLGSSAKVLRYVLQSAMLGIGAYLVVIEQASGGIMIASSILMGRTLAPIEVALGTWKQLTAARQGIARLRDVVRATAAPPVPAVRLPPPRQHLSVQEVAVFAPGKQQAVVSNISFQLRAGQGMALLGPSASGKSTLARALVGIWPVGHGKVRLDGATLDQWNVNDLGSYLGYLPQNVALFDGTIAANIARFDPHASSRSIIEAAQMAGAHEMILRLPNGYETEIGESGSALSSGQRQRIGLARAVFGEAFLIILDEPDANLDVEGERALAHTIVNLRNAGRIVIVISHRPHILQALDMALLLHSGRMVAFGSRDQVFQQIARQSGRNLAGAPAPALEQRTADPRAMDPRMAAALAARQQQAAALAARQQQPAGPGGQGFNTRVMQERRRNATLKG